MRDRVGTGVRGAEADPRPSTDPNVHVPWSEGSGRVSRFLGWPLGLAILSGGLLTLAFPGTGDQGWLAFGALVPLLVAVKGVTWRHAAIIGGIGGLTFWLITLSWVVPTMVRYGGLPWPLASVILLGLAGYLALYSAAFCAFLSQYQVRSGALYVVMAASLWVALEFLRTFLFTGFPWNLLGYSQYRSQTVNQIAAVTGVYGVSFVVMAVNAALARAILAWGTWRRLFPALGTAGLIVLITVGYSRLGRPSKADAPSIPVVLVQGNISQDVKWDPSWQDTTLGIYRDLTRAAVRNQSRLVVWPETAIPFFFRDDPRGAEVEALAHRAGSHLLVGAPDRRAGQLRNTAFLLGPGGQTLGRYDKRHLVPFGEYVPLKEFLSFADALAGGAIGDFTPGQAATVFSAPFGRFGVVICYEAIFPGEVREFFLGGADFLVNITNDAWFGRSAAPRQHLAMAVFRAIENRAYLIRAANTGISAIVAPDGEIVRATELYTPAIVAGTITARSGVSVYTRYGDIFAWATVMVALIAVFVPIVGVRLGRGVRGSCWR